MPPRALVRKTRTQKRRAFNKRVRSVVDRMSEAKFIQMNGTSGPVTLSNYPAAYIFPFWDRLALPTQGTGENQFIGNQFTLLGFTIHLTVELSAAAVSNASARMYVMQGIRNPQSNFATATQYPTVAATYIVESRSNSSTTAGSAAGAFTSGVMMTANDATYHKWPSDGNYRLPIFKQGNPLLPGWKVLKEITLDTLRPEGTYNACVKRYSIWVPWKKTVTGMNATQNAIFDQVWDKGSIFLVFDACQVGVTDSSLATNNATGVTINFNYRTHYRDV